MVEWDSVEVVGPTVEKAVEAGIAELGLSSAGEAEIEVIQEPTRGFLGMGGKDAVVRVRRKEKRRRRRRRSRNKNDRKDGSGQRTSKQQSSQERKKQPQREQRRPRAERSGDQRSDSAGKQRSARQPRREDSGRQRNDDSRSRPGRQKTEEEVQKVTVDINEQAEVVEEFLRGLVDAFGFEGEVETRVEEDIIFADVSGVETEALVGERGSVMQSILELTRTVVQRKTQEGARIRLDIAGYGQRRREALQIYAARLAEQILEDGGEIMLEPMNPAERKVVHDAVADIEGVRTYSEGVEPDRSVVIGPE